MGGMGAGGLSNGGTPYQQPMNGGMGGMGQLPGLGGPVGSPNGNSVGGMGGGMNNGMNGVNGSNVTGSPPFGTNDGGIPNQMGGGMNNSGVMGNSMPS